MLLKVFVFAVFLALITATVIYRLISGSSKKQKFTQPTYITLEELSRLWCPERRQQNKQNQPTNQPEASPTQTKKVSSEQNAEQTASTQTKQVIPQQTNKQNQQTEQTPPANQPSEQSAGELPAFRHGQISDFWRTFIQPNANVLRVYLPIIEQILDLLDKHGDCPSVVSLDENAEDREAKELASTYDALSQITLLEHSLNVAREMIDICVKAGRKDYDLILGKMLITGLGHDLGKIPQLRKQNIGYRTGDHAIVSYKLLQGIIPDTTPGKEEILRAVRDHHYPSPSGELTAILKQADYTSREKEVSKIDAEAALKVISKRQEKEAELPVCEKKESISEHNRTAYCDQLEEIDLSWLDFNRFMEEIEKHINVENEAGVFRAFSMKDGLVYVMPMLISDTILKLAADAGHRELLVYRENMGKRRAIEYAAVKMLREKDLIPDLISKGYTGARFELTMEENGRQISKKGFYLPIRAEGFSTPLAELEGRKKKSGKLSGIRKVRPVYRNK